eukprot:TRINITY_DN13355_c0_g1_i1.p1 TRINITY_DN13355_c0_g1~~TRINITY_DN13355_c0_g1_i1.p1  ORF type:complete len:296 (-),score=24.68 TRINITY_DN13355_c0_g1_i1:212-1099(-)
MSKDFQERDRKEIHHRSISDQDLRGQRRNVPDISRSASRDHALRRSNSHGSHSDQESYARKSLKSSSESTPHSRVTDSGLRNSTERLPKQVSLPPDPTLDFFSESFNPLKALYELKTIPSTLPKVKPFDFLSKCKFLLPPNDPNFIPLKAKKKEAVLTETERTIKDIDQKRAQVRKQFLKEKKQQEQESYKPALQVMTEKFSEGPLSLLKRCMEEKCRIRVAIRRVNTIRGYCVGNLQAFDKHMNMVLRNVEEDYEIHEFANETSTKKELVKKQRRVKLLLIKGDNVVWVSRLPT